MTMINMHDRRLGRDHIGRVHVLLVVIRIRRFGYFFDSAVCTCHRLCFYTFGLYDLVVHARTGLIVTTVTVFG